jgi:hypothetical protein
MSLHSPRPRPSFAPPRQWRLKRRAKAAGVPPCTSTTTLADGGPISPPLCGAVRGIAVGGATSCDCLSRSRMTTSYSSPNTPASTHRAWESVLLDYLGVKRLILTGMTTTQCVLFTAGDASMRDFELVCRAICVAAADSGQHRQARRRRPRAIRDAPAPRRARRAGDGSRQSEGHGARLPVGARSPRADDHPLVRLALRAKEPSADPTWSLLSGRHPVAHHCIPLSSDPGRTRTSVTIVIMAHTPVITGSWVHVSLTLSAEKLYGQSFGPMITPQAIRPPDSPAGSAR